MRISDWSSDVCSSDLFPESGVATGLRRSLRGSRAVPRGPVPVQGQAAESGQGIASTGPRAALDSLISTIAKAWPPQIHGLALSCLVRPDRRGACVGFLSEFGRASWRGRVCQEV